MYWWQRNLKWRVLVNSPENYFYEKKKLFFWVILISLLILVKCFAETSPAITNYIPVFMAGVTSKSAKMQVAIRSFSQGGKSYFLVVDPQNFKTSLVSAQDFQTKSQTLINPLAAIDLSATPYFRALEKYSSPPYPLDNDGLVHANHVVNGYFLTVDMCPSHRAFEEKFYNTLVNLSEKNHQPIPVAISVSGLWIAHHADEFNWLLQQQAQGKLAITWVNHSWRHLYRPKLPLKENFLLMKDTNFFDEVLVLEKILLARGQLPSVFFRFPGLISNEQRILQLRSWGLIPLGADAWLAKNEIAKRGSIILVHGNSNEPEVIRKIMPLIENPNFIWLPLSAALN